MDVPPAGSILKDFAEEGQGADEFYQGCGQHKAEQAPAKRQDKPFEEDLQQDVATARPQGLEHTDLTGPLGHRNQHDVHDADGANAQREGADDRQQDFEAEADIRDQRQEFIPLDASRPL
jgi:hypothetical protein